MPPLSAATIAQVVHKTLHEKPTAGTHWSIRKMAAAAGLSYTSVQLIWKAHELKPHLVKTFKLSNDKLFTEKVQDIVGARRQSGWFGRQSGWMTRGSAEGWA